MHPPKPEQLPGHAKRHETWHEVTAISTIGRRSLASIPNYALLKAATRADATAAARLLLVHLVGYLGTDAPTRPESRFVVFPGNQRLSDELRCTPRSIQRQADELESKGLLRRCYNGMNRRTGFDLTPFAMQHEQIMGEVVSIQTERKAARDLAQLELSLEADRVARPATSASSQGDADVTHNSTDNNRNDGGAIAEDALDGFDWRASAERFKHLSADQDRTEDPRDAVLASITRRFTGGGRASHLGWGAALSALGRDRAVALYLVAEADPRRRATPERYFGWLLRMVAQGDEGVVTEAAGRAASSTASLKRRTSDAGLPEPVAVTRAPGADPIAIGDLISRIGAARPASDRQEARAGQA